MMMGLLMGVVMNLNPLLKFDGYYVLSDLLQISQLREQALPYVRNLLLRPFRRGADAAVRVVGIRRRRAYLVYGLLTLVYSYVVIVCFFEWLRVTMVHAWAETGFVLTACMVGLFIRKPVTKGLMKAAEAARRPSRSMLPWALGFVFRRGAPGVHPHAGARDRERPVPERGERGRARRGAGTRGGRARAPG
jgi:putative peptide zinc metalloprotease protein